MIGQFLTSYDSWLYCRIGLKEGPLHNFTIVAKLLFLLNATILYQQIIGKSQTGQFQLHITLIGQFNIKFSDCLI